MTEFPVDNILIQGAFRFFSESSKRVMMDYAPIVFLIRVVMNMFSLKGAGDYLDLIKDTILMFVGIMMFREVMLLILNIPKEAQELIYSFGNPKGIDTQSEVVKTVLNSPMGFLGFSFNDIDLLLGEILKGIALIVYWAVYWFYFLFIFIAICLGSYVIFFASMFQMRWVLSVFLITVTIASLWPFIWYGTDYVLNYAISELAKEGSSAGILTSSIVTNLLKIIVPLGSFTWAMSNPVSKVSQIGHGISRVGQFVVPTSARNLIFPAKYAPAPGFQSAFNSDVSNLKKIRAYRSNLDPSKSRERAGKNQQSKKIDRFSQVEAKNSHFEASRNQVSAIAEIKSGRLPKEILVQSSTIDLLGSTSNPAKEFKFKHDQDLTPKRINSGQVLTSSQPISHKQIKKTHSRIVSQSDRSQRSNNLKKESYANIPKTPPV